MFERYTDRSRRVVVLAQEQVRLLGHDHIGTEHLLLGLIQEGESVAAKVLLPAVSVESVAAKIERGEGTPSGHVPFTARCKKALEVALRESLQLGMNYIAPEHILLALLRDTDCTAANLLVENRMDLHEIRRSVIAVLAGHLKAAAAVKATASRQTEPVSVRGEVIGADFSDRDDGRIVLHLAVPASFRVRHCNATLTEDPVARAET